MTQVQEPARAGWHRHFCLCPTQAGTDRNVCSTPARQPAGVFAGLLVGLAFAGCAPQQGPPPNMPTPEVKVSVPVVQKVTDFEEFTGRTQAKRMIEIKARVTGYLDKFYFKEGDEVKEGTLLFEIDPRTYAADLARAEANVGQAEAHLRRLEADYKRAINLLSTRAVSQEEFDKTAGDRFEAQATLRSAQAARDTVKLALQFTKVLAPIDGRLSRSAIDPGNMVKAEDTTLTTIVSQDPMYAYFDVDERTLLTSRIHPGMKVEIGLVNETGYPHPGKVDFVDNQVDPSTGSKWVRGVFANPRREVSPGHSERELTPGLFVRVRLPLGEPHDAVLISEQALGTDQGRKYVYVIGDDNKAQKRQLTIGRLHEGLRVVTGGLKKDERVVVNGLQRVRDGVEVKAEEVPMPRGDQPAAAAAAKPEPAPAKGPSK